MNTSTEAGQRAVEVAIHAMGWTDPRMISDARKLAEGYAFKGFGVEGECLLTYPQVAHFRSCLAGVKAAFASPVTPAAAVDREAPFDQCAGSITLAFEQAGWEAVAQIAEDRGDIKTAEEARRNAERAGLTPAAATIPGGDREGVARLVCIATGEDFDAFGKYWVDTPCAEAADAICKWFTNRTGEASDEVLADAGGAFQPRVQPWLLACFGTEISSDKIERNHRFLEEALELVQALGCTASEAHQLVDYTFGREIGEPSQEVGGVMVTLAALCLANDLDMHAAGETELARIWTKVEAIRAKQAAKPKHSPLPAANPVTVDAGGVGERALEIVRQVASMEGRTDAQTYWFGKARDYLAALSTPESTAAGKAGQ